MSSADTFILNPHNRNFVDGRARRPASSNTVPGCMVLFMVPFLMAGVFTLWLAFDAWYRMVGFAVAPRLAEATVVSKGIEPDSEGEDDPYIVYRYSTSGEDGAGRYMGRAYVSFSDYSEFEPEDNLQVEYIAYSPTVSRITGSSRGLGEAGFLTVFTLFWNVITVPMFVVILGSRIKATRLQRKGQLLRGSLTSYETSTDSDNDLWVKLSYNFLTPTGQLVRGVDNRMDNSLRDKPAPQPGTPVAVLYVDDKTHTLL